MPDATPSKTGWTKTRSMIAVALQKNPNADVTELRRRLKAERLAEHVRNVVAGWPPLTSAQRDQIALLLLRGDDVV